MNRIVNKIQNTHNTVKLAYAAWALLYIIETLITLSSPNKDGVLVGVGDLHGIIPDNMISEIAALNSDLTILVLIIVILGGLPFVLLLHKNKSWIFSTFVASCVLSILGSVWAILYPSTEHSIFTTFFLQATYIALSLIMLKYAYRLRDEMERIKGATPKEHC